MKIGKQKNSQFNKIIGFFLILIGLLVIVYRILYIKYLDKKDMMSINYYFENLPNKEEQIMENNDGKNDRNSKDIYNYIGVIEIPKIRLKRGFLDINDKNNTVNKNIEVLKQSKMPDVDRGNLIIVGHSGGGRIAFFKDINKLKIGDYIFIYYKNSKYIYTIIDIHRIKKTGNLILDKKSNKNTITLITCIGNDNQIVVTGELKNINLNEKEEL